MNLEYYRVFCQVVKAGSVSGAARKLCITQPAVSQIIKQMEKELGGSLFVRTSKGLRLTKEGEVLHNYVKKGYDAILLGEEKYRNMLNLDSGEIIIGASDMTLQFYLLPYLEKFHEKYPNIKISVTNAPTPETLKNLNEGKIDFGIVSTPFSPEKDIECKNVKKINTIFVAGSEFSRYKGRVLCVEDILDMPLICLETRTSTREAIDKYFEKHGIKPEPEFELATSDIIVQFAKRNLGVAIVVEDFAVEYLKEGSLFKLEFDENIEPRDISVVYLKRNQMSSASMKLLEMMGIQ